METEIERERERESGRSWGRKLEVHLHTWQTREGKKDFEMVSRFFIRSFVNVLTIEKNRNRLSSRYFCSRKRALEWLFWKI